MYVLCKPLQASGYVSLQLSPQQHPLSTTVTLPMKSIFVKINDPVHKFLTPSGDAIPPGIAIPPNHVTHSC
jgi:hypothetical protein